MRLYVSYSACQAYSKVVLEPQEEGTYIFLFERDESEFPEKDELVDDLQTAIDVCAEDYLVPIDSWQEFEGVSLTRR